MRYNDSKSYLVHFYCNRGGAMMPLPGDVLISPFRSPRAALISVGSWLSTRQVSFNHVSVVVSSDKVIEAVPGGVRLTDWPVSASRVAYLPSGYDRSLVVDAAYSLLGSSYDWFAVVEDTLEIFGLNVSRLFPVKPSFTCSSLAAFCWSEAGVEILGERWITPWWFGLRSVSFVL